MNHAISTLELSVYRIVEDGDGVLLFDLRADQEAELPPFQAGAHIDVHLPSGLIRQYSLCNDSRERHRYVIAVALDPNSRGGSRWLHESVTKGSYLKIGLPRNLFPLAKTTAPAVLFAGGIGITPLLTMARELELAEVPWQVHHASPTKLQTALYKTLESFIKNCRYGHINHYFSRAEVPRSLNFEEIIQAAPANAHFYACGSPRFLDGYIHATADIEQSRVHLERFGGTQPTPTSGFTLVLARSDLEFVVKPGQTILDVLKEHNVEVPYACGEGVCGRCEVKVLEGLPDHHDSVLSEAEKAANSTLMVCCSGALSKHLVLDL